ncbi:hypothetical protein F4813DRAFT_388679 [Daldinia decipiens]|uniref:uncharacterized protein n=1 Tax=Daldinia decipiens TaxID=326647 RepID=UPI0020C4815A|nr:uncharacterized protein F4813DRAFT_388679 [Daldinia decipiens]KAI1658405.1 hypothetical protein F4813DRAFT_388679 [Daldinia decipiens]
MEVAKVDTFVGEFTNEDWTVSVEILAGKTPLSDNYMDVVTGNPIASCENKTLVNSWRCRGYGAATCTIQLQSSRSTTAAWGTGVWMNKTGSETNFELGMIDTHCITQQDIDELVGKGYSIDKTHRWLPYNESYPETKSSLTDSLLARKWINGPMIFDTFDGPQTLQHIYDAGRIDFDRIQQTFSSISDSLTTWIRTHGHENYSDPAVGQVFHYATLTVYSTALKQFPAWKASFLPWLIYGPGSAEILGVADQLEETSYGTDEIENKAKEITVVWKALPEPHVQLEARQE